MKFTHNFVRFVDKAFEDRRKFNVLLSVFIFASIIELSVSNISDTISVATKEGFIFFIILSIIFVFAQISILRFLELSTASLRKRSNLVRSLQNIVIWFQVALTAVLMTLIFQMAITGTYYTPLLMMSVSISWGLSVLIFGFLGWRFMVWYRSTHSFIVFLYAISCIAAVIVGTEVIVFYDILITEEPITRTPTSQVIFKEFDPGSLEDSLQKSYSILNVTYYLLLWSATALLVVRGHSRASKFKELLIVIVPLASFLSIFLFVDKIVEIYGSNADTVYVILFGYTLPNVASGILFGIPFWKASKSIKKDSPAKEHLILTGLGFVFLFVVTSTVIDHAPYPPIGLIGVSFVGLTTYLVFIALYFSAISVSEDMLLRKFIKSSVSEELRLFGKISSVEEKEKIEKKVLTAAKSKMNKLTEISYVETELSENEIREYMDEVVKEVYPDRSN